MSLLRRPPRRSHPSGVYSHAVTRLSNGLEIVTVRMPHLHSAQISLLARVGSRHEAKHDNGLSHFLEHMFFRGCEGYANSTALNAAMEDLGGHLDGYTTRDHSAYPVTVHPLAVEQATEILGRMFSTPRFRDIDIERRIVLEEMLDALDERGREVEVDTLAHRLQFGAHGLGQSIEGRRANVRRFSIDDLERHRIAFYGARNLVLCFAGAIEPHACVEAAERAFSGLHAAQRSHDGAPPEAPQPAFRSRRTDDPQTRLRLSFRTVSDRADDFPALALLHRILDGGLSARLPVEVVEKRGIAYEVGADLVTYADSGSLDFELAVAHRKLPFALEILGRILSDLRSEPVDPEELERVRARAAIGLELGLDSAPDMVQWFGVDHLVGCALGPEERLARLESVSVEDVLEVARRYLRPEVLTAVAVGGAKPKDIASGRRAMEDLKASLAAA